MTWISIHKPVMGPNVLQNLVTPDFLTKKSLRMFLILRQEMPFQVAGFQKQQKGYLFLFLKNDQMGHLGGSVS